MTTHDPLAFDPQPIEAVGLVSIDLRATGLPYYNDGTPNEEAAPCRVALCASVLDENNQPVLLDELSFRVHVPGHLATERDLTELARELSSLMTVRRAPASAERARTAAQASLAEGESYPTTAATLRAELAGPGGETVYVPDDPSHGLVKPEAAALIKGFVGRFQGGTIIAAQNLVFVNEMLSRLGVDLVVEAPVYHRMIEVYTLLLANAMGAGGQLSGIPSLAEVYELQASEDRDPVFRTRLIQTVLGATEAA